MRFPHEKATYFLQKINELGSALASRNAEEQTENFLTLEDLRHVLQMPLEDIPLHLARVFKVRWERIRGSALSYTQNPDNPVNALCLELAHALCPFPKGAFLHRHSSLSTLQKACYKYYFILTDAGLFYINDQGEEINVDLIDFALIDNLSHKDSYLPEEEVYTRITNNGGFILPASHIDEEGMQRLAENGPYGLLMPTLKVFEDIYGTNIHRYDFKTIVLSDDQTTFIPVVPCLMQSYSSDHNEVILHHVASANGDYPPLSREETGRVIYHSELTRRLYQVIQEHHALRAAGDGLSERLRRLVPIIRNSGVYGGFSLKWLSPGNPIPDLIEDKTVYFQAIEHSDIYLYALRSQDTAIEGTIHQSDLTHTIRHTKDDWFAEFLITIAKQGVIAHNGAHEYGAAKSLDGAIDEFLDYWQSLSNEDKEEWCGSCPDWHEGNALVPFCGLENLIGRLLPFKTGYDLSPMRDDESMIPGIIYAEIRDNSLIYAIRNRTTDEIHRDSIPLERITAVVYDKDIHTSCIKQCDLTEITERNKFKLRPFLPAIFENASAHMSLNSQDQIYCAELISGALEQLLGRYPCLNANLFVQQRKVEQARQAIEQACNTNTYTLTPPEELPELVPLRELYRWSPKQQAGIFKNFGCQNALEYALRYSPLQLPDFFAEPQTRVQLKTLNFGGQTALMILAASGNSAMVSYLLNDGAKVMEQDINGNTALHLALINGHEEVAALLLDAQADLKVKNMAQHNALDCAIQQGSQSLIRLILESASRLASQDKEELLQKTYQLETLENGLFHNLFQYIAIQEPELLPGLLSVSPAPLFEELQFDGHLQAIQSAAKNTGLKLPQQQAARQLMLELANAKIEYLRSNQPLQFVNHCARAVDDAMPTLGKIPTWKKVLLGVICVLPLCIPLYFCTGFFHAPMSKNLKELKERLEHLKASLETDTPDDAVQKLTAFEPVKKEECSFKPCVIS